MLTRGQFQKNLLIFVKNENLHFWSCDFISLSEGKKAPQMRLFNHLQSILLTVLGATGENRIFTSLFLLNFFIDCRAAIIKASILKIWCMIFDHMQNKHNCEQFWENRVYESNNGLSHFHIFIILEPFLTLSQIFEA